MRPPRVDRARSLRPNQRIAFLDALRIFAFLSVLLGHKFHAEIAAAANDPAVHATIRLLIRWTEPFIVGGGAGVVVFFLVSGYIITEVVSAETTLTFVLRRIFRIYPLYVVAVLAEVVLGRVFHGAPFPGPEVLLPRLLLLGDLFGTPLALGGVEWTLRLEILFYAVMAMLKLLGVVERPTVLPWAFLAITIVFQVTGPVHLHYGWTDGFVTVFLPFLFVGALINLGERRLVPWPWAAACCAYFLASYFVILPGVNPRAAQSHFAAVGILLFLVAWRWRNAIVASGPLTVVSELTYPVYLLHLTTWAYLEALLGAAGLRGGWLKAGTTALLFLLCLAAHHAVERPANRLGRRIAAKLDPGARRTDATTALPTTG